MSHKALWLISTATMVWAGPSLAQDGVQPVAAESASVAVDQGEIVVTATRRAVGLSNVPIAVSAITGDSLQNSGATDIRGLNQLSPSLFVSSSSSEAVGGVARIRGIGTVGDNPGLESAVATFIDGVYRSRSGTALTELGEIERIEVLRGPQGTLFGRNASAGLINVITKSPSFEEGGTAEASYGNYDYYRFGIGLTGPIIADTLAYRIDGIWQKRDGFIEDVDGGRHNNRNRWLARGQLLFQPSPDVSLRLIADYAKRNEDCCAAPFLEARDVVPAAGGGVEIRPSSTEALIRLLGGDIREGPFRRKVAITDGLDYHSDVRDWGLSGQLDWDFGGARLTSITAYRDWESNRGQDPDFGTLDLLRRTAYNQRFRTFTQELRLQGKAFGGALDWLVGGYYGHERLDLTDNLRFGADYGRFASCRVVAGSPLAGALFPRASGCIAPPARPLVLGQFGPALGQTFLDALDGLYGVANVGATQDRLKQTDKTWALFTHNVINVTDRLSLTLGARYTHDEKKLDASLASDSGACGAQVARLGAIAVNPALPALARQLARSLVALTCANNIAGGRVGPLGVDGNYNDKISDNEWSGTVVLSYKPVDRLLTYASYSKGFKAGGFNLDRASLSPTGVAASALRFKAEKADSFEVGLKYRGRGFRLAAAGFYSMFKDFQLNAFNGVNFVVVNVEGCKDSADPLGPCTGKNRAGVVSKGVEVEASVYPLENVAVDVGYTLADTRYRKRLSGTNRALDPDFFELPGARLSNAPLHTVTGGVTWTPQLTAGGIGGLFHIDGRYMSDFNTGSDLFDEKAQKGFAMFNARIGITGPDKAWSLEFWGQNIFNKDFEQVVASAPLQGSGSISHVLAGRANSTGQVAANSLFFGFPGEPRTYGVTVRTKF